MKRLVLILTICLLFSFCQLSSAQTLPSGKIVHYELYVTDGYVNTASGVWPIAADYTVIAGWPKPLYIWGFTDDDPNVAQLAGTLPTVPAGAIAPKGGPVGNAKFPGPFLEVGVGDDVYLTVHNRGFYQKLQKVQDDHTVHLHGIHAQAQYDGFPESAGGYTEQMRYFWLEFNYTNCGATIGGGFPVGIPCVTTKDRDTWWNSLSTTQQSTVLAGNPVTKANTLNGAGGIFSQFNLALPPNGVGGLTPAAVEAATQYTYYFRAEMPGTYMYHCHVAASEHVQMGMYGALIIRPVGYNKNTPATWNVYGTSATSYDKEYTLLLSEIDPNWHAIIEQGKRKAFYPPNWKPELWFVNGRTFPTTLANFGWNKVTTGGIITKEFEPRYDTYMNVVQGDRLLIRYINMGYQEHPMHQHGWHMKVVGSDAREFANPLEKYTLLIGSGETYDTITTANPVYGVAYPQGARLGQSDFTVTPLGSTPVKIRQIFPIHDHDDYRVTTNGIYPGGALVLMEATGISGAAGVTWANPYVLPPGIGTVPAPGQLG